MTDSIVINKKKERKYETSRMGRLELNCGKLYFHWLNYHFIWLASVKDAVEVTQRAPWGLCVVSFCIGKVPFFNLQDS